MNAIQDTYEQFNASLGFKASPYPGLWFNLYGGYQDLKDDLYQVSEEVDNNVGPDSEPMPYQFLNMAMTNSHNFYAGMKISYEYKDIVAFNPHRVLIVSWVLKKIMLYC